MFAYCGNNPVIRKDSAGDYWETALDVIFILVDIYILAHDNGWKELENWAALTLDVAFTAIPVATGGGLLVSGADRLGDLSKITVIGESMARVSDFAKTIGKFDNLYGGLKLYEKLADYGKLGQGIGNLLQLGDNALWLLDKLRNNFKIVDIGFDLSRPDRSAYYAVEQLVMTLWEHRHELKALFDMLQEEKMDSTIGNSKVVVKHLGFLVTEYNMQFKAQKFNFFRNFWSYTYSFYNENGCFTIRHIPQRDETSWYVSDAFSENEDELLEKHIIQGLYIQGSYWLWGTGIKRLAASISSQIAASGDFFGIKVEK